MTRTRKKHEPGIPKGYLGMRDMKELLDKSRSGINAMIADGRLPKPLKDGRLNIWDKKTIQRWLENAKFARKR